MKKKVILLSGIAGSGKSTWALNYVKDHLNTAILSTDEVRYDLFGTYTPDRDSQKIVMKEIIQRASEYSSMGISVIIDTAVVVNKNRVKWYNRLRPYYDEIDLVIIDTSYETCLKQNLMRSRHVPEKIIAQMEGFKEEPNELVKKLFNRIEVIKR